MSMLWHGRTMESISFLEAEILRRGCGMLLQEALSISIDATLYQFAVCRIKNGGLPRFHTITEPVFQQASTDSATHQSDCQMRLEAACTPLCRSRAPAHCARHFTAA